MTDKQHLRTGIDIGSTTAKLVILGHNSKPLYSAYERHNAETRTTLVQMLGKAIESLGDIPLSLRITGSAGMGLSEAYHIPFIQEVIASAEVVRQLYPQVRTLIDIGGEDAKMIFFSKNGNPPDIRMNGSCAGGTGAFIDQMATLLNIPVEEMNQLASRSSRIYPIASRCGVFAKTDIQNLLSREVSREDIVASIFYAVVLQTMTTLARGYAPTAKVLLCGGPLTFMPELKDQFIEFLNLSDQDILEIEHRQFLPAMGAAIDHNGETLQTSISGLITHLKEESTSHEGSHRLSALSSSKEHFLKWNTQRMKAVARRGKIQDAESQNVFLGIDSGSTTTKIVLINENGDLLFSDYRNNNGAPILAVQEGLKAVTEAFSECKNPPEIKYSVVTGYGEDLIRIALNCDAGMVETLAHFRAAHHVNPDVSFILDIGGQDMKALFIENGHIRNIVINEACSSGCGSFIESFSRSLGFNVADFAHLAFDSSQPCDLGTRCTVFMNSKVKQSLREGAEVSDISAGLAYSVIKNALHKVLNITNTAMVGSQVIVQGGTFRNPAVHKAIENLLGLQVTCPDISELMGAYGAALTALDVYIDRERNHESSFSLDQARSSNKYTKKQFNCNGCENRCTIIRLKFNHGQMFFTGNRCERVFSNSGQKKRKGINHPEIKYNLLFDRPPQTVSGHPRGLIGIPRVLNMYENYPFWHTLFTETGFEVHLSGHSNKQMYEKGASSVMSEHICFPAKVVHGHIMELIEARVDRIFYPMVFFETREYDDAVNCFNCPIVSGYPDVIRSAIDPMQNHGIPFDKIPITFADTNLLKKNCYQYFKTLGVSRQIFNTAFQKALHIQAAFKAEVRQKAEEILENAKKEDRKVILLVGRPYHIDPLINHHLPTIITDFGMDAITEDAIPIEDDYRNLDNRHVLTQWTYPNRYYHVAKWIGQNENVEIVHINSFACGPDAIAVDEVRYILREHGKNHTVIRVDEIESIGSMKLRLRSLFESLERKSLQPERRPHKPRTAVRPFLEEDRHRILIAPEFSQFCTAPLTRPLLDFGYNVQGLPHADRESVELGLKYTNNEICYPATIVIGDLLKALLSGEYDPDEVAVGITQTGGPCRASSYISLLKKGMVSAGFEDVPIVSVSTGLQDLHEQPGFEFNNLTYYYKAIMGMLYADSISHLYHATAVREKERGTALKLADKYMARLDNGELHLSMDAVLMALEEVVDAFNAVEMDNKSEFPKVGIIGEIYAKYNAFSNFNVARWLMDQKIEVIVPPLLEFFSSWVVGPTAKVKQNLQRHTLTTRILPLADKYVHSLIKLVDQTLQRFRHYQPGHSIHEIASKAEEVVNLAQQYGEGWLISGEIGTFVKHGINNILCLQPFGCIANQVIAKGVEKRMKSLYPNLNLLFLDVDAGMSEVNFYNRLHFFVSNTKTTANV